MDVLDDFSIQMPASIIADMVGLPHEHRAEFLEHAKRFNVAEETDDDPCPTEDAMAASLHVDELVTQIVAEAAKNPGDDVMGSLLKAHIPDFNGGTYQLREDQVATRVVELAGEASRPQPSRSATPWSPSPGIPSNGPNWPPTHR